MLVLVHKTGHVKALAEGTLVKGMREVESRYTVAWAGKVSQFGGAEIGPSP